MAYDTTEECRTRLHSTVTKMLREGADLEDVVSALEKEYDDREDYLMEQQSTTQPVFEALVDVKDAVTGRRRRRRTFEECADETEVRLKLRDDPSVEEVQSVEQTGSYEVYE